MYKSTQCTYNIYTNTKFTYTKTKTTVSTIIKSTYTKYKNIDYTYNIYTNTLFKKIHNINIYVHEYKLYIYYIYLQYIHKYKTPAPTTNDEQNNIAIENIENRIRTKIENSNILEKKKYILPS